MHDQKKQQALNRLQNIKGKIRGVARMVQRDVYCIEIVDQTLAVKRAIVKLKRELLHAHLKDCVIKALREDNDQKRERVIRELLDVFSALLRG
jgi:DNA-binding FrmR family transcriptional regulator